jgi:5'-nucleotidase
MPSVRIKMDSIIIPKPNLLKEKIAKIKQSGKDSLHVLADFDRTLTHSAINGIKTPSLISHLRNGNYLTEDYAEKAKELFNKYHPIEISASFGEAEKAERMKEWWSLHYKLLATSGLNRETIEKAIKDIISGGSIKLRAGVDKFLDNLNKNDIPFVIISSAGIGNMIQDFLREQNLLFPNMHIVGNILEFNKEGKFIGIKDNKIIHVLNKREVELKGLPIYGELQKRKNIILLGDSMDDLQMVENSDYENLISIIFLENPAFLEQAKQEFDVIITDDGDFNYINELLGEII